MTDEHHDNRYEDGEPIGTGIAAIDYTEWEDGEHPPERSTYAMTATIFGRDEWIAITPAEGAHLLSLGLVRHHWEYAKDYAPTEDTTEGWERIAAALNQITVDPDFGEGDTDTEEDARFTARIESDDVVDQ